WILRAGGKTLDPLSASVLDFFSELSSSQRQQREAAVAAIERNANGGITSEIRVEEVTSGRWEADIGALVGSIEPTNANAIEPELKPWFGRLSWNSFVPMPVLTQCYRYADRSLPGGFAKYRSLAVDFGRSVPVPTIYRYTGMDRERYRSRSPPRSRSRGRSQSRSQSPIHRSRSRSRSRERKNATNPGNTLYVTGLSSRVTERDLESHFSREGKVCCE
ncbi:hypothetical protein GW17_00008045, partial [Ensete ventricosum]